MPLTNLGDQAQEMAFDGGLVTLEACHPTGTVEADGDGNVKGWHTWKNGNQEMHALFEVQVLVNGEPVQLAEISDVSKRVDATTYRTEVGPKGAEATTAFWIPASEIPTEQADIGVWMSDPEPTSGGGLSQ